MAATTAVGSLPYAAMAATHLASTPATSPRRPAWAAATTPATGSASRTGTQSATSTPRATPGRLVTSASQVGVTSAPGGSAPTTCTVAPCTCRPKCTPSTPSQLAMAARLAPTAAGSSPTAAARFNSAYGPVLH